MKHENSRTSTPVVPFATDIFPQKPEEITSAWINEVFRKKGLPHTDVVTSIELQPIQEGFGEVGIFSGIKLNYDMPPTIAPRYLFAKFSSDIGSSQLLTKREVSFFRDIAPSLRSRIPICYFSGTSLKGRSALLLEFFTEGSCGDNIVGCTPKQAEQLITSAADLHAQWWDSPELLRWDWLQKRRNVIASELQKDLTEMWPKFREEYGAMIPEWAAKIAVNAIDKVPELFANLAEGPVTLIHGDMQLDNVWFGFRDDPVIFFDWAGTHRAQAASDICDFFTQSYPTDQRRAHEDNLLNTYIEKLHNFGIEDYSLTSLRESMALRLLIVYITKPIMLAVQDFSTDRSTEQFHSSIHRCVAMLEDYPVDSVL